MHGSAYTFLWNLALLHLPLCYLYLSHTNLLSVSLMCHYFTSELDLAYLCLECSPTSSFDCILFFLQISCQVSLAPRSLFNLQSGSSSFYTLLQIHFFLTWNRTLYNNIHIIVTIWVFFPSYYTVNSMILGSIFILPSIMSPVQSIMPLT